MENVGKVERRRGYEMMNGSFGAPAEIPNKSAISMSDERAVLDDVVSRCC